MISAYSPEVTAFAEDIGEKLRQFEGVKTTPYTLSDVTSVLQAALRKGFVGVRIENIDASSFRALFAQPVLWPFDDHSDRPDHMHEEIVNGVRFWLEQTQDNLVIQVYRDKGPTEVAPFIRTAFVVSEVEEP